MTSLQDEINGTVHVHKTPDRVTVSIGRRISITRFDGCDVFMSYSQDVVGGKPEAVIRDTEKKVVAEFERLVKMVAEGDINVGPKKGEPLR